MLNMIIGHQIQRQFLKNAIANNRLPQAMIFSGQEELGKKAVAREFIALLKNSSLGKSQPAGNPYNQDFIEISPLTNQIQIDQIRNLEKQLTLTSGFGGFKTVIIDSAHTLNKLAQNCFLKTLEEPRGRTVFILITAFPQMLLSTIRSRCEELKFYPVASDELKQGLKNYAGNPDFEQIISASDGRPMTALRFLENPQEFRKQQKAIEQTAQTLKMPLWERLLFVKKFVGKDFSNNDMLYFLNTMIKHLRTALINSISAENTMPGESVLKIKQAIEKTMELAFLLSTTNVNMKLGLENLMLNL